MRPAFSTGCGLLALLSLFTLMPGDFLAAQGKSSRPKTSIEVNLKNDDTCPDVEGITLNLADGQLSGLFTVFNKSSGGQTAVLESVSIGLEIRSDRQWISIRDDADCAFDPAVIGAQVPAAQCQAFTFMCQLTAEQIAALGGATALRVTVTVKVEGNDHEFLSRDSVSL